MSQAAYHPNAPTTNFAQPPPSSNLNQGSTTEEQQRPSHHIHNPSERLPAAGTPDATSRLYDPANSAANPSTNELYQDQNQNQNQNQNQGQNQGLNQGQGVGNDNQSALKGFKTDPNQTNANPNAFDSHSHIRKHDSPEFAQSAAGANALGDTAADRDPSRPTHFHPNDQSTRGALVSDDKQGTGLGRVEHKPGQHDPARPTHHHPHDAVHDGEKAAALATGAAATGAGAGATHGTNTTSTAPVPNDANATGTNTAGTNTAAATHGHGAKHHGTNTTDTADVNDASRHGATGHARDERDHTHGHGDKHHGTNTTDTGDVHDASRHGATGHTRDERDHTHGNAAPTSALGADDRNRSHLATGATAAGVATGADDLKEGGPAHRHAHHGHPQEETRHFQGTGTENDNKGTDAGRTGAGLVHDGNTGPVDLPEGKPSMMDKLVGKAQKMIGKSKGDQDMEQAGEVRATSGKAAAQEVKDNLNN